MTDQPKGPYKLSLPETVRKRLRELGARAAAMGFREEFLAALRVFEDRLADDPVGWGEPRYTLRVMGLLVCHKAHALLHVSYAVDEARRLVYIRSIDPLPGHPFAQDG